MTTHHNTTGSTTRPAMRQSTLTADWFNKPKPPARYLVGDLVDFSEDDPAFPTMQAAADHALECSEGDTTRAFGVWDEDGTCHLIAYGGDLFRK